MFRINANSAMPIYQQIVDQVRRKTASGQLNPGDPLPSVRAVASEHAVNAMTISKAYSQLEAQGLLLRLRGRGMVVAPGNQPASKHDRIAQLTHPVQQLVIAARQLGLTTRDVVDELHKHMESTHE